MPISPRKLSTIEPQTRLRKGARIFASAELDIAGAKRVDVEYLISIAGVLLAEDSPISSDGRTELDSIQARLRTLRDTAARDNTPALRRVINGARHLLYAETGESPAEWDLLPRDKDVEGDTDLATASRGILSQCGLYLDDIRSPFNVGSILRTAEAFGVGAVYLSSMTPGPEHPRVGRTARGAEKRLRVERLDSPSRVEAPAAIFALETGGAPVSEFLFPRSGVMVVGSEELGVEPNLLARCREAAGVVELPTVGPKVSINVSVAVGIAVYEWSRSLLGPRAALLCHG